MLGGITESAHAEVMLRYKIGNALWHDGPAIQGPA